MRTEIGRGGTEPEVFTSREKLTRRDKAPSTSIKVR